MKIRKQVLASGLVLLSLAASIVILVMVYAIQYPHAMMMLASIGWNGMAAH